VNLASSSSSCQEKTSSQPRAEVIQEPGAEFGQQRQGRCCQEAEVEKQREEASCGDVVVQEEVKVEVKEQREKEKVEVEKQR
jgi:hypothetical protein